MEPAAWQFLRVRALILPVAAVLTGAWVGAVVAAEPIHAAAAAAALGFKGPEIFPVDFAASQLRAADLDGDGKLDLVIVNNARSRIQILWNQTGKTNRPVTVKDRGDVNELPPDARFRIDSVASEKRIAALAVADLNGDGRPDFVYYGGDPKELVFQANLGTNGWATPKRWPIDDALLTPNALAVGDIDGDGRPDVVLLAETHFYVLYQRADHGLSEPQRIPLSSEVKSVQIIDVDGDGRQDLLLVNWDSPTPYRVRFQNAAGQLGPEIHFAAPALRSYWADDLDGDHKAEIVGIAQNSGRASVANIVATEAQALAPGLVEGRFEIQPLSRTAKAKRGLAFADINGDGLPDLLAADPESGQMSLQLQQTNGTFGAAAVFPTLAGITDIAVLDWDGDGRAEVALLSQDEKQVAVTRLDDAGKLPFPTRVALKGRPLLLGSVRLNDGARVLAVVADNDGKRSLQLFNAAGSLRSLSLGESFKGSPVALVAHDIDQDGLEDLIILVPYEKARILRQVAGGEFEEIEMTLPGADGEKPWCATADVDGDGKAELLLAQKNFVRAVVLRKTGAQWDLDVREQINGAAGNSRIVAAAALKIGDDPTPVLFLLDAERRALSFVQRDAAGVWRVLRNIPLPVMEFGELQPLALGAKRPNSIAFLGQNLAAWQRLQGDVLELRELDGYETPINDGRLTDVVSGDLNNDGRKDLVFLETSKHYIDIVLFEKPHRLVPGNRWQVFEERTFRQSRAGSGLEPREALVGDVTGDGKPDLVVFVHDRILVYPQE
jgi:hypothetical protein